MENNVLFVGHRGARQEAPENTLPGFRYATGIGLSAIEFDVCLTANEELVVIHDDSVDRTTNGSGRVAELTLLQIQALDASSVFPDWPESCYVPTLGESLDAMRDLPELMMEIKADTAARLERVVPMAAAEIAKRGMTSQVTLSSFDPTALDIAKRVCPEVRRAFTGTWDAWYYLERAVELECAQAHVDHVMADRGIVSEAKKRGLQVMCWTTNTRDELVTSLELAPDYICTDYPTTLRQHYAELIG
ncbi:glycerophosphodiester phosphodiesterase family protein [soil metagenome]